MIFKYWCNFNWNFPFRLTNYHSGKCLIHVPKWPQFLMHYIDEGNEQLVQEWTSIGGENTTWHIVIPTWKSFWEPSLDRFIAGDKKKVKPKCPLCTPVPSYTACPPHCLSHTSSGTKTPFNHGETWQQMSVSVLHLINGNDSSVIHHAGWHFFYLFILFFFAQLKKKWTLFSQPPESPRPTRLSAVWGI